VPVGACRRRPAGESKLLLGAHLAHISTGNGGKGGVGSGLQKGLFCRYLLPFHALRNPLVPTLNRLDKTGLLLLLKLLHGLLADAKTRTSVAYLRGVAPDTGF
jgi:hypothetical protein